MNITINDKIYKEIVSYCELNALDVTTFINELIKKNFMVEKYGDRPGIKQQITNPVTQTSETIKIEKEVNNTVVKEEIKEDTVELKDNNVNDLLNREISDKKISSDDEPILEEKPKRRKLK